MKVILDEFYLKMCKYVRVVWDFFFKRKLGVDIWMSWFGLSLRFVECWSGFVFLNMFRGMGYLDV